MRNIHKVRAFGVYSNITGSEHSFSHATTSIGYLRRRCCYDSVGVGLLVNADHNVQVNRFSRQLKNARCDMI